MRRRRGGERGVWCIRYVFLCGLHLAKPDIRNGKLAGTRYICNVGWLVRSRRFPVHVSVSDIRRAEVDRAARPASQRIFPWDGKPVAEIRSLTGSRRSHGFTPLRVGSLVLVFQEMPPNPPARLSRSSLRSRVKKIMYRCNTTIFSRIGCRSRFDFNGTFLLILFDIFWIRILLFFFLMGRMLFEKNF